METKAVAIPRVPQEIIDEILNYLAADSDPRSLQPCALVSKLWIPSCRRSLFHTICFTSRNVGRWLETFPVPAESPAHYARDLLFSIGGDFGVPEEIFEHTPWFMNVERVIFLRDRGSQPLHWQVTQFWRLPRSVTSLAVNGDMVFLQIRDIMAQLPNLDNLELLGSILGTGVKPSPGIGTALRGRFGGKLRLHGRYVNEDITNMLLEVPTGLHFTEVRIHAIRERLLSTVRLAEMCAETLVKLSYRVSYHRKSPSPGASARKSETDVLSQRRRRAF